jgi:hypothetical protein
VLTWKLGYRVSEGTPIAISEGDSARSQTGVGASSSRLHAYPIDDPRYMHVPPMVAEHARETPNSVCNQPRHRRRSNAMKLITP